jgi:carbamoyl-phosphate synthase small subunit
MLADGTLFEGEHFGAEGEYCGEVVFNTAMTGYQEILSDPSYRGQIVCLTYPLVGNYGINEEDVESAGLHLAGLAVREYSRAYSNWRGVGSLENLMIRHGIVGIREIDTRALTRRIREHGAMTGIVSTERFETDYLMERIQAHPSMAGSNYVDDVTCDKPWNWTAKQEVRVIGAEGGEARHRVVALDYGIKYNILRSLTHHGCEVTVVPANTGAEELLERRPDGIVLSNGPGDPAALEQKVKQVQALVDAKIPVFGICLGHQLLATALGGATFKLPFGHHGANHPVKDHLSGRVEITSQNHGFAVLPESLPSAVEITHTSLYDGTVEGLRHKELPIFSVQYHPEASPGPHDSAYLFQRFTDLMKGE